MLRSRVIEVSGGNVLALTYSSRDELNAQLGRLCFEWDSRGSDQGENHNRRRRRHIRSEERLIPHYQGVNFSTQFLLSRSDLTPNEEKIVDLVSDSDSVEYIIGHLNGDLLGQAHELRHARFFLDSEYQNEVTRLWSELTERQQETITRMLSRMGYPVTIHLDEFQAYTFTERTGFWGCGSIECQREK